MDIAFLQQYWWTVVALLAGILVFMLFVQGGQSLLMGSRNKCCRDLMVASLGRKWELTFTTLVMFGGALFAAFPLFYSTSFGGAYWLWMIILFTFVVQAVSYEFRTRKGNLYTSRTYDILLVINGTVGTLLLGVAVGTIFFGGDFTVDQGRMLDTASPVVSRWGEGYGLDAILHWKCLLTGFMVLFLARTLGALYFINNISDPRDFGVSMRIQALTNGTLFVLLFVSFLVVLLRTRGVRIPEEGSFTVERYVYWHNLTAAWWLIPVVVAGVAAVVFGIYRTAFSTTYRYGIWYAGAGTVAVVASVVLLAGVGNTAILPSLTDPASSLTVANASSTAYTLQTMAWASLIIPVVVAYVAYVWAKMNARPITVRDLEH